MTAFWCAYGFAKFPGQIGWRIPTALQGLILIPALISILFSPESPRWLMEAGRVEEGRRVLERLHGTEFANAATLEIQEAIALEHAAQAGKGYAACFAKCVQNRLRAGPSHSRTNIALFSQERTVLPLPYLLVHWCQRCATGDWYQCVRPCLPRRKRALTLLTRRHGVFDFSRRIFRVRFTDSFEEATYYSFVILTGSVGLAPARAQLVLGGLGIAGLGFMVFGCFYVSGLSYYAQGSH